MAQTNYTPIQIYYSTTAAAVPLNTNLASGELAINITDGLLFYKDNGGTVQKIGYKLTPTTAGGTGLTSFTNGGIVYASSTSALSTGSGLTWSGTAFAVTGKITTTSTANDWTNIVIGNTTSGQSYGTRIQAGTTSGDYSFLVKNATNATEYFSILGNGVTTIQTLTVGLGAGAVSTNTAVGYQSLYANTTGSRTVAVGDRALLGNTTGERLVAIGSEALTANTTGSYNTGVGWRAMQSNTSGAYNIAVGELALTQNTTGSNNTSLGSESLFSNTTASYNTAVGYQAGYTNQTGTQNVFLGYGAGYTNNNNYNVFIGMEAGRFSTGTSNNFLGYNSGYNMTTGSKNTILGSYTGNTGGLDIRTASNRIVLSDGDGNPRGVFDSNGNYMVGAVIKEERGVTLYGNGANGTYIKTTGTTNYWITNDGLGTGAGTIATIYNDTTVAGSITVTSNITAYTSVSDYRLKENVQPMTGALAKVTQLKPVTYTWKVDGASGQGFIAHELQAIVPDCVVGVKDALDENGNISSQSVDASFLVATLTAAIQELKAEVDSLKSQLNQGA